MSLTTEVTIGIATLLTGSLDIEQLESRIAETFRVALGDGSANGQANSVWSDARTLAGGASESLDLNGNALKNAFGANLAITSLKALVLIADAANTTTLTVGNVANGIVGPFGAATQSLLLPPGGMVLLATPDNSWTITAATADLLKIANAAGAAASYTIIVIGAA